MRRNWSLTTSRFLTEFPKRRVRLNVGSHKEKVYKPIPWHYQCYVNGAIVWHTANAKDALRRFKTWEENKLPGEVVTLEPPTAPSPNYNRAIVSESPTKEMVTRLYEIRRLY